MPCTTAIEIEKVSDVIFLFFLDPEFSKIKNNSVSIFCSAVNVTYRSAIKCRLVLCIVYAVSCKASSCLWGLNRNGSVPVTQTVSIVQLTTCFGPIDHNQEIARNTQEELQEPECVSFE
jgi:hypothetical protein